MYSVRWSRPALDELAELWLKADPDQRAQVTEAVRQIDALLQRQASTVGESREVGFRVLLWAPLGVEYELSEAKRRAYVLRVWRYRTRDERQDGSG